MNDRDKQIEDRAKTLFDDSVEGLDAATLSRLNQGRHEALEELAKLDPRQAQPRDEAGQVGQAARAKLRERAALEPGLDAELSATIQ